MINKDMMQDVYSTEEVKTNKIWIDGKPIYRTVLSGMIFDGKKDHNIKNIDNITFIYGTMWSGAEQQGGNVFPINTVRVDYPDRALGVYMDKSHFAFDKGSSIGSDYSYRIVAEYTKTTD